MDAAAGVSAAVRNGGVSLPLMSSLSASSQPARKKWRAVSEQSVRNTGSEDLERSKVAQSDERLIYEVQHGRDPVDVDFCSITMDGEIDNDIFQQRLNAVAKQREELQQIEIELRAKVIARSELMGIQNTFDAQLKEQASANAKLQEQLREKEQRIHELERKLDEKERELHDIRLDNEAAWAKEDLLREQSKELQSYRRERDNSEAERAQHIKQIHDLQEHIQEKERQSMELQEQNRIAQETIIFKDEQLREAQAWITRAQEMDALQSNTNHTLQAELRDRTEQYNQLWLGCQRQFAEMERLHLHIQQLQFELADVREKSGSYPDGLHATNTNSKDASQHGVGNGSQLELKGNSASVQNVNSESVSSFPSTQADHVHGVAFAPSSLVGMPAYLPTGQVTALHPFVMPQQGVPNLSHVTQSHLSSVPTGSLIQNWPNQQVLPDGQHEPLHDQNLYLQQTEQIVLRTDSHYDFEASVNGQDLHSRYMDSKSSQGLVAETVVPSPNGGQVIDSVVKEYDNAQSHQSLQQISSQFHDAIRLNPVENGDNIKEKVNPGNDKKPENKNIAEQSCSSVNASSPEPSDNADENISETSANTASSAVLSDAFVSSGQKSNMVGKHAEDYLLDERALLAAIARTIGSGGRIRISSTLPNRLGKMLAPLHWHDYKKRYGKLDDFVACHPELFLIEGDHIQLREGAQAIIAATAAVAKVAAAAAATPSSYSSLLPSVAVTPMAQSHRLKKFSSLGSSSIDSDDKASFNDVAVHRPSNTIEHPSQFSTMQSRNANGNSFHVGGGVSNIKILSKLKDHVQVNGSESRAARSVVLMVGNGKNSDRTDLSQGDRTDISQGKGASHGRPGGNLVGKQNRTTGSGSIPRG